MSGFCKLFSNTLEARSGFPLTCHPQHAAVYLNNHKVQRPLRQKETLGSYTLATGIGQLSPLWWGKSLCLWKGQTAGWVSAGFSAVCMLFKEIAFCHAEGIMCFQSPDLTCCQGLPSCKGKQCFSFFPVLGTVFKIGLFKRLWKWPFVHIYCIVIKVDI